MHKRRWLSSRAERLPAEALAEAGSEGISLRSNGFRRSRDASTSCPPSRGGGRRALGMTYCMHHDLWDTTLVDAG